MLLLLALPELLGLIGPHADRLHEQAILADGKRLLDWQYRLAAAGGVLAVFGLLLWRRPPVWQRLVLAGLVQTLVVFHALVPRVMEAMQGPVKEAGLNARELDRPTFVYRTSMPSFSVYRQAVTPELRHPEPGQLIFLRIDKLDRLAADYPGQPLVEVYRGGPVALLAVVDPGSGNGG